MKQHIRNLAAATACAVTLNMPVFAADTEKTYLSEFGSCKRIAGLHEYYEANGKALNPDTQFYYHTKNGHLYEITRAGNAGMRITLKGPDDMQYEPLKGHIAALCEQYFGSGYQISEGYIEVCVAVQIDGTVPDVGPSDVFYEIRLPEQGEGVQEKAEALYRTLVGEQYPVTECIYYPEFGYVNPAYPQGYAYNTDQAFAITAYLEENEPDWQLVFRMAQDENRMFITRRHDAPLPEGVSSDPEGIIYAKVFEALGYWPDSIVISDGCSHDFGIDLTDTVQAEVPECPWNNPSAAKPDTFYKNARFFMTNENGTIEYYNNGREMLAFRVWPGYIAFRLTAPDAVSYEEMQALAKKYSDSYSVNLDYDFCVLMLDGRNYDPSCADAIKKELTEKGVITAFYGPGDVATVGFDDLETDGSALFYRYADAAAAKKLEAVQAWLAENRTDCTAEDYLTPADTQAGRTDPTYLRIAPKAAKSEEQLMNLACDIYRVAGIWPQWRSILPHNPVYAVRNNRFVPAEPEVKGEPCEWKSTRIDVDADGNRSHEKFWKDYTRFDSKGMFGGETYISESGYRINEFNTSSCFIGCYGAEDINCTDEQLLANIQRIAEGYYVRQEAGGLIMISPQHSGDFPEQDMQRIRSELISKGLISEFYAPGEVASVSIVNLYHGNALYYYNQSIRVPDERFNIMKAWLEENRPGCTITIADGYEISRTDVSYIKVTPAEGAKPAELFEIAAGLYELTGKTPLFDIPLPNEPVYAVRNDNMAVKGDMNLDGQTDVSDAVMAARFIAEDSEVTIMDRGMKNGDVQANGQVDSDDLILLLKVIAKQVKL